MLAYILIIGFSGFLVAQVWAQATDEDMILDRVGKLLDGKRWAKALTCPYCSTFWFTGVMVAMYHFAYLPWLIITTVAFGMFMTQLLTYNDIIQ